MACITMMKLIEFTPISEVVIRLLMENDHLSQDEVMDLWFNSKTLLELRKRKLDWASPARCYYELKMELDKDPRWMTCLFSFRVEDNPL